MSHPTVEWAPFRLAAGATIDQLLQASAALQRGFLAQQPGFVRRELLHAGGRDWVDLIVWRDRASVDAAMPLAMHSPACTAYFALMELPSTGGTAAMVIAERKAVYEA